MTERAVELLLKKLDSMTSLDEEKILILEQSIVNGWQGVFELKKDKKQELSANMKAMLLIEKNRNEKGGMAII